MHHTEVYLIESADQEAQTLNDSQVYEAVSLSAIHSSAVKNKPHPIMPNRSRHTPNIPSSGCGYDLEGGDMGCLQVVQFAENKEVNIRDLSTVPLYLLYQTSRMMKSSVGTDKTVNAYLRRILTVAMNGDPKYRSEAMLRCFVLDQLLLALITKNSTATLPCCPVPESHI